MCFLDDVSFLLPDLFEKHGFLSQVIEGESRFRDVKELVQLLSIKAEVRMKPPLTLKPTVFPTGQAGQLVILPVDSGLVTHPS